MYCACLTIQKRGKQKIKGYDREDVTYKCSGHHFGDNLSFCDTSPVPAMDYKLGNVLVP